MIGGKPLGIVEPDVARLPEAQKGRALLDRVGKGG